MRTPIMFMIIIFSTLRLSAQNELDPRQGQYGFFQTNILLIPGYAAINFDFEGLNKKKPKSSVFSIGNLWISSETLKRSNFYVGYQYRFYMESFEDKGINFFIAPYTKFVSRNVQDAGDSNLFSPFSSNSFTSKSLVLGGNVGVKIYWKQVSIEPLMGFGAGRVLSYDVTENFYAPDIVHLDANMLLQVGIRF